MTKTIIDLINRTPKPDPWSEGDNIPWNDPAFSERMLKEHLSQEHDLASRNDEIIDRHVEWIYSKILNSHAGRILDLACGPGLYASRLSQRGCECVGIDFSPASIRYANEMATANGSSCSFTQADVRDGAFGEGFDLVMMIYGQFNVFPRDVSSKILENASRALNRGGRLVLEVQSEKQLKSGGQSGPSWYSAQSGLFSDDPHLVLQENFWDDDTRSSTLRFSAIDGKTGQVDSYSFSNEAYSDSELRSALALAGFAKVDSFPSLLGYSMDARHDLPVLVAQK